MKHNVLIVDDELYQLQSTTEFLSKRGYSVDTASSGKEAIRIVEKHPKKYSLVVLDYRMDELNGAATTAALIDLNPALLILIFSADPTRNAVLLPYRQGAMGFVDKRDGAETFLREVGRLCKRYEEEIATLSAGGAETNENDISSIGMVGRSKALGDVARKVVKLQANRGPVLVLGETGTGKEHVARALHGKSRAPFIAVNCADFLMSPDTASSKLFGHVRGAFTGAVSDKEGVLEAAKEGTLFLDEIYALPMEAQMGLLRALESRFITPLGSNQERAVRCRLIAAAKPDLLESLDVSFKSDLFYRISENIISIPSLTARLEDLRPLVAHFCSLWSSQYGTEKTFLASTIPHLERWSWPGNARELKNVVFSLLNTAEKDQIGPDDLDARFRALKKTKPSDASNGISLKQKIEEAEKEHLTETLANSTSLREAARKMGVSPATVSRMVEKFGIRLKSVVGSEKRKA